MRVRILGHQFPFSIVLLACAEFIFFAAAFHAATFLRFGGDLEYMAERYLPLWPKDLLFAGIVFVSYAALGLYSARQRAGVIGVGARMIGAHACGVAAVAGVFYFVPSLAIGRGVTMIAAVISLAGSIGIRALISRVVDINALKKRVLIYGWGKGVEPFNRLRRRSDRRGFTLVGFVCPDGQELNVRGQKEAIKNRNLADVCWDHDVDEIVIAMEDRRDGFPDEQLLRCRTAGIHVVDIVTFLERETGRVYLNLLNPSWIIFGDGFRKDAVRSFLTRAFDIVTSSVLLLATFPLMLLTVLAIWIEDGFSSSVFYRQVRVGLGGAQFNLYKFRSMRVDAERNGVAQWAAERDPRITRVGWFIRRCRIDELPQLICVLSGQMSFVGPRPERPQFVDEFKRSVPFYAERHSVKPGITGWAQLCYPYGASATDAERKLEYDLYYVKNKSLLFDLSIIVQTAEVILLGRGAR